jgi:tRNA (guanine26-N2/guanine27-N2)-dimethyltransferase
MEDVENKLKDYEIVREGEAEIIINKKIAANEVFYNPVQVHNRDMSVALLRTFIAKREEEHKAMMDKRDKAHNKVSQSKSSGPNGENGSTGQHDEMDVDAEKETNKVADETEDLSTEATKTPSRKVARELKAPVVLEALAASGLRSIRYAREIDVLEKVVALDIDKACIEACKRNIKFNGASAMSKIEPHLTDARVYMLTHPKEFDVVSLSLLVVTRISL